jgi:hypothetical protein
LGYKARLHFKKQTKKYAITIGVQIPVLPSVLLGTDPEEEWLDPMEIPHLLLGEVTLHTTFPPAGCGTHFSILRRSDGRRVVPPCAVAFHVSGDEW